MFRWLQPNRNRRTTERQFVLDVKLRTRPMRVARWRAAGMGAAVVLAFGVFAFLFWRGGHWFLDDAVYGNPTFAIRQIDVHTDGVLSPVVLKRWAMVRPGQNLLSLDLMRVKRDLEVQSPVASASVERVLPDTLRIYVTERQAIAQTTILQSRRGGGFNQIIYDFDEDGVVMPPLDPAWRLLPAPTNVVLTSLTRVPLTDLKPGHPAESVQVQVALHLLLEMDRSPMAGMVELQTIDVSSPEILEAATSQGAHITFGLDHFDTQVRRWREIYDHYQTESKAIASLDLSISNHLPARWVANNTLPPLLNKFVKPIKPKRKNV